MLKRMTVISPIFYTERNFQTATRYFLIYLNIYNTYIATIYTQYGKINYTEPVKISFS